MRGHPLPVIFIGKMIKNSLAFLLAIGLLLFGSQIAVTQPQDDLEAIKKEIETLKKNQANLQRELDTLKKAMRGRRRASKPFEPVVLSIANDPYKGNKSAKLTLMDFSDYQ